LVVDGTDGQVAFEFFECLFDFGELEVAPLRGLEAKNSYFQPSEALGPA
jgi:hypothetical protein